MDSKIVDLINVEIDRLPARGKKKHRYRRYELAKERLCRMFPERTPAQHEYICKAIAKRYKV